MPQVSDWPFRVSVDQHQIRNLAGRDRPGAGVDPYQPGRSQGGACQRLRRRETGRHVQFEFAHQLEARSIGAGDDGHARAMQGPHQVGELREAAAVVSPGQVGRHRESALAEPAFDGRRQGPHLL